MLDSFNFYLKISDLRKIISDNKPVVHNNDADVITPELPIFKSEEGKLSAKKINPKKMNAFEEMGKSSPELPSLKTHEANLILSSKKYKAPEETFDNDDNDSINGSPMMPSLATINLKSLLQSKNSESTIKIMINGISVDEEIETPEMPNMQSEQGRQVSGVKKINPKIMDNKACDSYKALAT